MDEVEFSSRKRRAKKTINVIMENYEMEKIIIKFYTKYYNVGINWTNKIIKAGQDLNPIERNKYYKNICKEIQQKIKGAKNDA
jgi:hypothetical protein